MLTAIVYLQALKFALPAITMLGVSPCFMMIWGTWRSVSAVLPTRWYHAVDDIMYSNYQRLIVFFYEHYTGVEVLLYGDVDMLNKKENVIYISNHQSTIDWIVCDFLSIRQGSLGHLRYVLKDGLKYFPLYGFYLGMHGGVYVKRSGQFQEKKFIRKLNRYSKYNIPLWLVIFPEGTRYNPNLPIVIQKSQGFAYMRGYTVLNQVLTPRVKATAGSLKILRQHIDAIYDITIAYEWKNDNYVRRAGPDMTDFLTGCCPRIHIHLRRVPVDEVPDDEDQCQQWLHEAFEEKDIMLEDYYSNDPKVRGQFPGKATKAPLSLWHTVPSLIFWCAVATPFIATERGRSLYWKVGLFSTFGGCLWMSMTT